MNKSTTKPRNVAEKGIKILREDGMVEFSKKILGYIFCKVKIFILPYTLLRINFLKRNCNLQIAITFAFDRLNGLIKPKQVRYEIYKLLKKIKMKKPKIVLEIGTANGGTLFLFSFCVSEHATIISIDLPRGTFGGGYPAYKIPLYKAFAQNEQKIHLIRANSHSISTFKKIKILLKNKSVDFLFIDGDHSGVKEDFKMYSPLVRRGGMIAFHDIVPGSKENVGDVPEFWRKIRDNYESEEIVKDWSQDGFGIGIIYI